ncbi:hypothetical protein J6P52_00200 [bacterium]|nr:hypothetical protein [bacterium]
MDYEYLKYRPIKDKSFSRFLVDRSGESYGAHPILILEMDDQLIFLKAQSAKYLMNNNHEFILKEEQSKMLEEKRGILVKESNKNLLVSSKDIKPLFTNNSIVDTTQLYVMSKKDFERFYDYKNDQVLYNTRSLTLEDREKILKQLKNNLADQKVSLTEIYYNQEFINTKLIFCNEDILENEFKKKEDSINKRILYGRSTENDLKINKEKHEQYKQKYKEYENKNYDKIVGYLHSIYILVEKEYDSICSFDSFISERIDFDNFENIASEYNLNLDNKVIYEASDKAYDVEVDELIASEYERNYYRNNPEEYYKKFPDIKEEFDSYCKRLSNIKNNLEKTEKDINKISDKNTRKEFNELKAEFDLTYQHEILTNDVLDEYDNKINEIDKSLNKDQGMTL